MTAIGPFIRILSAVFEREFRTVTRTRSYIFVSLGFAAVLVGLALVGGVSGYISVVLNLLLPLELLLPVLAAAFGYRALVADRVSGEMDMLRTLPLPRTAYVGGILIGRLAVLLSVVLGTLVLLAIAVPLLTPESSEFLRRQTTYNSSVLFVRFTVVTAIGTSVLYTIMMALSAIGRESERALALAALAAVGLAIGIDVAIVAGFATDLFSKSFLPWLVAASPLGAVRTLILGTVVDPAIESQLRVGSVSGSILSLVFWFIAGLAFAVHFVWPLDES